MGGERRGQRRREHSRPSGGEVLSEFTPAMVELVADVARNPAFPESSSRASRRTSPAASRSRKASPSQMAAEAFRAAMYPGQSYGRLFPAARRAQGLHARERKGVLGRRTTERTAATLYVVGVFDAKATEAAIRTRVRRLAARPSAPAPARAQGRPRSARSRSSTVRARRSRRVWLGMPVVDPSNPDYVPLVVTNALLGRLLRVAHHQQHPGAEGLHVFAVQPGLRPQRRARSGREIGGRHDERHGAPPSRKSSRRSTAFARSPPSAAELKGIQNYLAGTFVLQNSSRAGIANQLQFLALHGLPDSYLSGFVTRVHAVTPEEVTRLAKAYIRPDRRPSSWSAIARLIDDQLKPYQPPTGQP